MKQSVNANDAQSKKNIETVMALYDQMINKKQPHEAVKKYLTSGYIQHNPLIPTSAEGLGKFFAGVQQVFPRVRVVVHNAIAVGDYVWTHVNFFNTTNNEADDRGVAGVDIFRFEGDKIAEHWDTLQPVPDPATAANTNTMFYLD